MADWLRRASEWIGLGPRETDRYRDYDEDAGPGRERVLGDHDLDDESAPYRESEGEYRSDRATHRRRDYGPAEGYVSGDDHASAEGHGDPEDAEDPQGEATEVTQLVPARRPSDRQAPAHPGNDEAFGADDRQDETMGEPQQADLNRIIFISPKTFNEARSIGENYRDGFPVIINLTFMEHDQARRIIDFASGLIFGLKGSIEKVDAGIFLMSPENVHVTTEDKRRIADGFYN